MSIERPDPSRDGWYTYESGDGLPAGTEYRFVLDGGDALPDPRSASQPSGIDGPSAVIDHDAELAKAGANVHGWIGALLFFVRRYPLGAIGAVIMALFVATALFADQITTFDNGEAPNSQGNTVSLETEMTANVKDSLTYESMVNSFNYKVSVLRQAIGGKP